jgi:hypothetical protein
MFVRVKSTPNSPRRSVQIVESRRRGDKIQQVIVRHIGIALDEAEEQELRRLAQVVIVRMEQEAAHTLPLFAPEDVVTGVSPRSKKRGKQRPIEEVLLADVVEEDRVVEGVHDVFGKLFEELDFNRIVDGKHSDVLKSVVLARVAQPSSKHRTAALLERDFGIKLPLDRIYRMMDALFENQGRAQDTVQAATLSLFPGKVDMILFDVTTLYFESVVEDDVRKFGYSKDQKYHCVQVVLALATTRREKMPEGHWRREVSHRRMGPTPEGLPVGYRLFAGNTAETKTLIASLESWKTKVQIGRVTLVADRAMMSESNLLALQEAGIEYVVGASLRKMKAPMRREVLDEKFYRCGHIEDDFVWTKDLVLDGQRRLIAAYSSKRARKDQSDRDRLVDNARKRLGNKKVGDVKKMISNKGFLSIVKTEGKQSVVIDDDKIAKVAQWDGLYGVITNAPGDALEILSRYRRLWVIEESFRIHKHDLAMRPIYHWTPQRIEAHVAICYLAFALLRHAHHRIRIRQGVLSVDTIRNELLRVQASVVRDKKGGGRYRIPACMTTEQKSIYRAFDIVRSATPSALA